MPEASASEPHLKLFHLTYTYIFFLLFLLHFLGHPQARGRCSQGERVHSGRDPRGKGLRPQAKRREKKKGRPVVMGRSRVDSGKDPRSSGGTGKAEAA